MKDRRSIPKSARLLNMELVVAQLRVAVATRDQPKVFSCLGARLPPRLRPLYARLSRGVETPRRFAEANKARSTKRSEERRANFEAGLPLRRRRGARKRKLNSTVDNEQVRASADPTRAVSEGLRLLPSRARRLQTISCARSAREREARTSVLTWKTTKAEEEEGEGGRRKRL